MPYEMLPAEGRYEMLPAAEGSTWDTVKSGAGNVIAGLVRGAGSIGATITDQLRGSADNVLGTVPAAMRPAVTAGLSQAPRGEELRSAMTGSLRDMGADTDSLAFGGGKLAAEIMGTYGAGGAAANLFTRAAPRAAAAVPGFLNAMRTGGLSANGAGLITRTAGGGTSGALTAGLANPADIPEGAAIGALLPGGVKLAGAGGSLIKDGAAGLTKNTLGLMSGVGGESVGTAYRAGKSGATNFIDNMRGNVPMTDVLDSAKGALSQMRLDRAAQYRSGMSGVSADKTVIDFAPIDSAVSSIKAMGNYKGQVINKNAAGTVDEISNLVTQWKGLDPKQYHTPEGLDALKQAISDVRDTTQFGTAARKAADTAYNAVKGEITAQAPAYAKVMKDYSQASETLAEIERALSLGNKAAADTSMRKLQSLMRNNVNTNFGNRMGLAQTLESNGANILPAVAGQAMSSITPRGLQGLSASGIAGAGLMTSNPLALAALPLSSPRLIGEAAYGLGALNRGVSNTAQLGARGVQGLLGGRGAPPLTRERLLPLLAAAPILAAGQR